ncbi:MAG: HAD-IA family hydrolase, partial [Chloroflexi bacterium]|nr:HAD-IA family hydrolase [Chloroflexota bacterium]
ELRRLASEQNAALDVSQFATDWRVGMFQTLGKVRSGELPWTNADQIHRNVLDDVLTKHTAIVLSDSGRDDLNNVWHRLNAWPDAPAVIEKLRSRYTVVVLTVLSWSIAVDCSKHNGISWDGILSCEFLGHYKPDAEAYQKCVSLLRLEPDQAMMVAAHHGDLRAAMAAGLRSAYVHREGEVAGVFDEGDSAPEWDINTRDFAELERQLLA